MAEDQTNGVDSPDLATADKDKVNGSPRSNGSKIANLRAAFEKGSQGNNSPGCSPIKRRFVSSERLPEHDAELSQLREELEKERELRSAYEEQCTTLEEEVEDLHKKLGQRDGVGREEHEHSSNPLLQERDEALAQLQAAENKARDEADILQKQLADLKRSISRSTRAESHITTDSTFVQEMSMLYHEMQNWVVNHFRKAKTDFPPEELCRRLREFASPAQLERLKPFYEAFDPAEKFFIYQGSAMCLMMDVFDEPLLYGLPVDHEWCIATVRAVEHLRSALEPPAYNKWRAMTVELLRQRNEMPEAAEIAAKRLSNTVCRTLCSLTEVECTEAMATSVQTIIKRAISLAHLFRVQRAQYEFKLPSPGSIFDVTEMEDIAVDADTSAKHLVRCTLFPTIIKLGDAEGENMELRNVVAKAKVQCRQP